ncbi:unnamed protein product, partial [Discosporangium mesarthrocarpum]
LRGARWRDRAFGRDRSDRAVYIAGLRVYGDHRCVPRKAASGWGAVRGAVDGADLSRRRFRADHHEPAERGHGRVPGYAAVLLVSVRRSYQIPCPFRGAQDHDGGGGMSVDWLIPALLTIVTAATPLVFAAVGEVVVEKAGVLNLGVEGMMIIGAIAAFATAVSTGSEVLAILAGAGAGVLLAVIFGVLTVYLQSNQVATGLALTIFGLGLSALIGHSYVGKTFGGLAKLDVPGLSDIPVIGPVLFGHDALVYLSVVSVAIVAWVLTRTRTGLLIRAVGENHDAAHSIGYSVTLVRMGAIMFGGAMAGIGGAYLSVAYTPLWVENMTAGRGWIALALVVFASW